MNVNPELAAAVEFGFRCAEKGMNLEATLAELGRVMDEDYERFTKFRNKQTCEGQALLQRRQERVARWEADQKL